VAAKTTTAIHTRGRLSNQSLIADPWGVPFVDDASRGHTKLLVANYPHDCEGPLLAQSRHAQRADECPLLGTKRTLTNGCLPISIYEYTA
jgi:hypothetical protein